MYPADQLGIGYSANDLPDTIELLVLTAPNVEEWFILPRDGSQYGPIETTFTIGATTITYDLYVIVETFVDQLEWFDLFIRKDTNAESLSPISPCLFDPPPEDIGFNIIEDNFADTYTVTTNQSSGVVSRQSVCLWEGTDGLGCPIALRYENRIDPPRTGSRFKWTVDYAEGGLEPCNERAIAVKGPNQNTPVGDYDGGIVTVA